MITTTLSLVVKCDCHGSQTMAKIENGVLYIVSKHHGQSHVVSTPIDKLKELCNASPVKS